MSSPSGENQIGTAIHFPSYFNNELLSQQKLKAYLDRIGRECYPDKKGKLYFVRD